MYREVFNEPYCDHKGAPTRAAARLGFRWVAKESLKILWVIIGFGFVYGIRLPVSDSLFSQRKIGTCRREFEEDEEDIAGMEYWTLREINQHVIIIEIVSATYLQSTLGRTEGFEQTRSTKRSSP